MNNLTNKAIATMAQVSKPTIKTKAVILIAPLANLILVELQRREETQ